MFMPAFITIFAFDSLSFLEFIIHLIPTIILVGILLVAWKKPLIGGPIYILIGAYYFFMTRFKAHYLTYILLVGPILITGVLFLREGIKNKQIHLKKK